MSVYVDEANIPFRNMRMSHMVADSIDELHEMAENLGLKKSYFQEGKTSMPHYDVSKSKREKAIELGAKPVSASYLVNLIRRHRIKSGNNKG